MVAKRDKNRLKRAEIEACLRRQGYGSRSVWPHLFYHPDRPSERYKMTELGVKFERRLSTGDWARMKSGYYRNLTVAPDDSIAGMSVRGM